MMRIAVAGLGYVGLSLAVLLAQRNEVRALDVAPSKVEAVNRGEEPHPRRGDRAVPGRGEGGGA